MCFLQGNGIFIKELKKRRIISLPCGVRSTEFHVICDCLLDYRLCLFAVVKYVVMCIEIHLQLILLHLQQPKQSQILCKSIKFLDFSNRYLRGKYLGFFAFCSIITRISMGPKSKKQIPRSHDQNTISLGNQPAAKKSKQSHPSRSKSLDSLSQYNEDSQIIHIRHGDEQSRQHIRPSFLKRWDGQSRQVEISGAEMSELTPLMRTYWEVKSQNMNAVVLVEMGRQYMAFENDAIRLHEILKKKLHHFSKFLMVPLWGKEIEATKHQLFHRKIPLLVMTEIDDPQYKQKHKTVKREVTQVITPALHLDYQNQSFYSRLLVAIVTKHHRCGILVLDSENNHFFTEEYEDDELYHETRRMMHKYRPVELLITKQQNKEISKMARQICNPYINEIQTKKANILKTIERFKSVNTSFFFEQLRQSWLKQSGTGIYSKQLIVYSLALVWTHLQSLGLLEKVFHQGIFHPFSQQIAFSHHYFDSQVYENLEVFRIKSDQDQTYAQPGTLIAFLDSCKTNHGRKLLHRWLDQPLTNISTIQLRQQAIQQLSQRQTILTYHDKFQAYSKLQKRVGDIYHWVTRKSQQGRVFLTKSMSFDRQYDARKNPVVVRLTEIAEILSLIKKYEELVKEITHLPFTSTLLKQITRVLPIENIENYSVEDIGKLDGLPEISYIAESIGRRISYDELTGNLQPVTGECEVFDSQKREMERVHGLLEGQLMRWREYFSSQKVTFASVKAKREIQVPKGVLSKKEAHKDLIFSSQTANFVRYTTHQTYQLGQELIEHQQRAAESYEPFFSKLVAEFCSYRFLWDLQIQSMAQLDVLISLAKAAKQMPVRCLPTFRKRGISIKNGYHPNLLAVKEDIVANSIIITEDQRLLLLTGPNMGGKSTFLKQVLALAILAQIGSYVPALQYQSSIYDQIFCRMGASDRILEGKSTFYVQLQQTKRIISGATENSLVVIDQLGRGTSTFDGMAIAQGVLDYLIKNTKCICLFSTHYTQITNRFEGDHLVKLMKMGCRSEQSTISFTYQLVEGVAERSFASNVAKMAGIPQSVIQRAEKRAGEMQREIDRKKHRKQAINILQELIITIKP